MILVIDAGNTNIVFALYRDEEMIGEWRTQTETRRTADDYAVWLSQLLQLTEVPTKLSQISGAIIATVVPELLFPLTQLCRRYLRTQPMVVGESALTIPVKALIDRPEELGADRLVNAVAAHLRYPGPLLVVDFGTATTFDLIDRNGNYCGGVIAPGINLSLHALYQAAAKLPRVAIRQTEKVIATSTIGAMQSGIFWGYVGLIEGLISRIRREQNEQLPVVATGGLAPLFAKATEFDYIDTNLTLFGLYEIYKINRESLPFKK
ncbi:MAG: type III pantothenate kinase [Candidatus Pacebacteria bacterium]|nr:type III pantothenate kinase [Candidatus Paceibacterota bacterium]